MLDVTEEEILQGLKGMLRKGYFIEPTSATAFAGVSKLIKEKKINPKDKTLVIITGNGLKASDKILKYISQ